MPQNLTERATQIRNATRDLIKIVVEAIKDFTQKGQYGGLPNSHLWLMIEEKCPFIDFDTYCHLIASIEKAGFIRNQNHLLIWLKDLPENF